MKTIAEASCTDIVYQFLSLIVKNNFTGIFNKPVNGRIGQQGFKEVAPIGESFSHLLFDLLKSILSAHRSRGISLFPHSMHYESKIRLRSFASTTIARHRKTQGTEN
jgi:hypothetical protein